jgi:hypothetical protein
MDLFSKTKIIINQKNCNWLPKYQRNDNFINKTFTIVTNILLWIILTIQKEKKTLTYYKDGVVWFLNPKTNECEINKIILELLCETYTQWR